MSQQVNLLRDGLEVLDLPWSARHLLLALIAALVLVGLWAGLAQWQAAQQRQQLAARQATLEQGQAEVLQLGQLINARQPDPGLPLRIEQARLLLAQQRWVLQRLQTQAADPATARLSVYLQGLGRQRIDGLWVRRLLIDGNGSDIALQGQVNDPARVPEYLARLGVEAPFAGRDFQLFRLDQPEDASAAVLDFYLATRCQAVSLQPICAPLEARGTP